MSLKEMFLERYITRNIQKLLWQEASMEMLLKAYLDSVMAEKDDTKLKLNLIITAAYYFRSVKNIQFSKLVFK